MLPTYFQTLTSIISFHLQSFNKTGTLECSTGQTKKWKKCGTAAKIIPFQNQTKFCLCASFFALYKQQGIPHPNKGLLHFSKNMLFQTTTFSEFWAAKKHTSAAALYWAEPKKTYQTLPSLGRLVNVWQIHVIHCGEKCPLSSTVTRLTDEIRLSTKRLLNCFLTQNWGVYKFFFQGKKKIIFLQWMRQHQEINVLKKS